MKYCFNLLAMFALALLPGCGGGPGDTPDIGNVHGTIKVDGQPKAGLQVGFQPEDGRPSSGSTDSSGNYELRYSMSEDGAKVGKGVMSISTPAPESDECCGGCGEDFVDPIPPRYNINAADNPKMNIEVKPGDNPPFDFDIDTSIREEAPDCGGASCCCG